MKRIALSRPDILIDEIRDKKSLNVLAEELGVATSSLKAWRRGERTIPEHVFHILMKKSANSNYWKSIATHKDKNWGQKKGGRTRIRGKKKESLKKEMEKVRSFRPSNNIKVPKLDKDFCELFGALMGDGCLSRYDNANGYLKHEIVISGDKELDREYHKHLAEKIYVLFGIHPHIFENKQSRGRRICVFNKKIFWLLASYGFPIGKKGEKLRIPKKFLGLSWDSLKFLIRGIFDTDGCISAKKSEGYRYPILIITSKSTRLIEQLRHLLNRHGHSCYLSKNKTELRVRGGKPIIRWMEDIGSSNSRHLKKYMYWKKNNIVPVRSRARSSADM